MARGAGTLPAPMLPPGPRVRVFFGLLGGDGVGCAADRVGAVTSPRRGLAKDREVGGDCRAAGLRRPPRAGLDRATDSAGVQEGCGTLPTASFLCRRRRNETLSRTDSDANEPLRQLGVGGGSEPGRRDGRRARRGAGCLRGQRARRPQRRHRGRWTRRSRRGGGRYRGRPSGPLCPGALLLRAGTPRLVRATPQLLSAGAGKKGPVLVETPPSVPGHPHCPRTRSPGPDAPPPS